MRWRILYCAMAFYLFTVFPAHGQFFGADPDPKCTLAPGTAQLSIDGDLSRVCGPTVQGSTASIIDATGVEDCNDIPNAVGTGAESLFVQWDASLGSGGEWKCIGGGEGGGVGREAFGSTVEGGGNVTSTLFASWQQLDLDLSEYRDSQNAITLGGVGSGGGPGGTMVCNTSGTTLLDVEIHITMNLQQIDTQNRDFLLQFGVCADCISDAFPQLVDGDELGIGIVTSSFVNNLNTIPVPASAVISTFPVNRCLGIMVRGMTSSDEKDIVMVAGGLTMYSGGGGGVGGDFVPDDSPTVNHSSFNAESDARIAAAASDVHHTPTVDTNATTLCDGFESRRGDGACQDPGLIPQGSASAPSLASAGLPQAGLFFVGTELHVTEGSGDRGLVATIPSGGSALINRMAFYTNGPELTSIDGFDVSAATRRLIIDGVNIAMVTDVTTHAADIEAHHEICPTWWIERDLGGQPTNVNVDYGAGNGPIGHEHDELDIRCEPLGTDCSDWGFDTPGDDLWTISNDSGASMLVELTASLRWHSSTTSSIQFWLASGSDCSSSIDISFPAAVVMRGISAFAAVWGNLGPTTITVPADACVAILVNSSSAGVDIITRKNTSMRIRKLCNGEGS